MPAFSIFKWLHLSSLWVYRMVTWAVVICGFVSALVVVGVRFWLLPDIESYRVTIARELSEATRQRITIGKLAGRIGCQAGDRADGCVSLHEGEFQSGGGW